LALSYPVYKSTRVTVRVTDWQIILMFQLNSVGSAMLFDDIILFIW
jgi:hypothetical protein